MDNILKLFLETQQNDALQLNDASDLLELYPVDLQRYVAVFKCRGLVRDTDGEVREYGHHTVLIRLPESYLREVNPAEILTFADPPGIWHPNIRPPFMCLGTIAPGTPLVELLHRCFEPITYQSVTMREDDALNRSACAWARRNRERFPIDPRPIKRTVARDLPC